MAQEAFITRETLNWSRGTVRITGQSQTSDYCRRTPPSELSGGPDVCHFNWLKMLPWWENPSYSLGDLKQVQASKII